MKVPNIANGVVSQEKVVGYLLRMPANATPLSAAFKGPVFRTGMGWTEASWRDLAARLHAVGMQNDVVQVRERPHGVNYRVDGELRGPNGRHRVVRTIWHIDAGSETPRLVSAY